ncbi:MAG: tetratricopeptide repeat protein [Planctomycetes bacterium]|nr:tetratricopeptide repeat protein [Planctomycetota bacterium]
MKPALAAAVLAVAAVLLAGLALRREARRGEELERRIATLEADLAAAKSKVAEPIADAPKLTSPVTSSSPPTEPAKPGADPRLAKLEKEVDRLEDKVRDLSRAARTSIDDEIAGLPAEKLWDKSQMALRDKLTERADALLRSFLQRFPNDPHVAEALLALGKSETFVGDYAEAKDFYEQLLRDLPGSPQAPYAEFYLGMSLMETGDLAGGTAHYEKSVEGLAGKPYWQAAALYNLGDAYQKKGQPEVAKEYYRKVGAQFGANAEAKDIAEMAAGALKGLEGK